MKKLFLLFALLGMVAVSCSKEQPNENEGDNQGGIPENIFFALDKESITISPDGGSVDVVVYSNYKWEISGTSDWCTPSITNGEANEDGQKVTFSADMTYDDREATFWFSCADVKTKLVVSQKLKAVIIPDENNSFNIPAEGGIAVISYQTSVDCEIIIPQEAQDWITIAPAVRGLVSESISLDIAENTTYDPRSAVIKVVAKNNAELVVEYTINQEQNDAILADDNNTFTVPSTGGEVVINYQTNVDCEVIIPQEAQDWITIAPAVRGLVSESISLEIAENTTNDPRSAVVKIVAKDNEELVVEYTITQEPGYFLYYTTNDGKKVDYDSRYGSAFGGVAVKSHTYEDGVGVIEFYAPITRIEGDVFMNCSNLTSVTIPDSVTSIGECAFGGCSNLTSVTMGDRVTSMGYGVFNNCHSLTEFNTKLASEDGRCLIIEGVLYCFAPAGLTEYTIPESVTEIYLLAFGQCKITSVTIPESVTKIGKQAFDRCKSLTSVTIGENVTYIGMFAFDECSKLTSVYCKPTTPPVLEPDTYGYWPFDQNASDRKIYVPIQSVEAYKCAGVWMKYTSSIVGYDF